jgi:hypothetical protein
MRDQFMIAFITVAEEEEEERDAIHKMCKIRRISNVFGNQKEGV